MKFKSLLLSLLLLPHLLLFIKELSFSLLLLMLLLTKSFKTSGLSSCNNSSAFCFSFLSLIFTLLSLFLALSLIFFTSLLISSAVCETQASKLSLFLVSATLSSVGFLRLLLLALLVGFLFLLLLACVLLLLLFTFGIGTLPFTSGTIARTVPKLSRITFCGV